MKQHFQRLLRVQLLILLGLGLHHSAWGQNWDQIIKTSASDRRAFSPLGRATDDFFGFSVAVDGEYAVVGAYQEDEDASGGNTLSNAGSVLIFKKIGGSWTQVKKIVATDRGAQDLFGFRVAISGTTVVVGAYQEDEDASGSNTLNNAGSAYIFSKDQGGTDNWGQVKKIVAADRGVEDRFGSSVAISGTTVVVGAYNESQDASGSNTLNNAGSAYIFSKDQGGTNNWGQVKKIVAADRGVDDLFGVSVTISGTTVVVGAYQEDQDASGSNTLANAGSAYIFSKDQGGTDNWGQVKKIVAADRGVDDWFGYSVAISGTTVVVGAYQEDQDASGGNTLTSAGSAYIFSKDQGGGDNWGQVKKIVAIDRGSEDRFGFSVAISGTMVVVGAYREDEDATGSNTLSNAGAIYLFGKDEGGTNNWGQVKKIVAADRGVDDNFGYSVAISGTTVVVGARNDPKDASGNNPISYAGSAYIFSKDQGGTNNWGQQQKIVFNEFAPDVPNQAYGISVAIDGDWAVVGALGAFSDANGANHLLQAGAAYILQKVGGSWTEVKKIVAADRGAEDQFGYSVAISSTTVVVGAYFEDEDASGGNTLGSAGSAYIFSKDQGGTNNWGQVKKIVAADRGVNDLFGASVAISGTTVVVGALLEDEDTSGSNTITNAGSAYLFSKDQGGTNNWGQVKKIVAADRGVEDFFGYSVAISGTTVVVGAYQEDEDASGSNTITNAGSAYLFSKDQGGTNNWGQVKKIVASDRGGIIDQFGYSVAISGTTVVVGANFEDEDASGSNALNSAGSAYIFSKDQGGTDNWGQVKKIIAADRGVNDLFGQSVAISGTTVVVGAVFEDEDATGSNTLTNAGSAYIFSKDQGGSNNWGQVKKIVAADRGAEDYFGTSVAISGNTLVVGAYQEDEDASGGNTLTNAGSAYFFGGACPTVATATDILTWTGTKNTDWADACNWSPNGVPTATNDVIIAAATNQPTIAAATAAVAKTVEVQASATLTIAATASLTINDSKTISSLTTAFYNNGTVQNNGQLVLGNTAAIGQQGLWNNATFNNNIGAEISIDRSTNTGLYNITGTFINAGKITIGAVMTVGDRGIWNWFSGVFNNNAGGDISINRSTSTGLYNDGSTFTNAGKIAIGSVASVGNVGLWNMTSSVFNNNATGEIRIDRCNGGGTGLRSFASTFTNAGKIIIGAVAAVGFYGLQNSGTFNNNAGAEISIDRSTSTGLYNEGSTFTNAGKITIGAVAAVGFYGLQNFATFNNNACGQLLVLQGDLQNIAARTITNTGLVQVSNTLQNDGGIFTNNGVLKYGTLVGSITNNTNPSIIVNNTPTPIFTYGGTFNGTINGIFTDAAATISAGAFTAPNTFVPSGLPAGLQTLYAKITLSGGSCSYVVPFTYQSNLCPTVATATDILTWTGTKNTDWADACNWSPNGVPTATNDVIIAAATNQPTIAAATAAVAKTVEVQASAILTIATLGSLTVNGSKLISGNTTGFYNVGTVNNNGALILGNAASLGDYGLWNTATFNNNTGGDIQIDRATSIGLYHPLGTFTNTAKITIGATAVVGQYGLLNSATFNNNTGGNIQIDRVTSIGLYNQLGTFTNTAKITIGATVSVGGFGLQNVATFNNNTGGDIQIDRVTTIGLYNQSGAFTNVAKITIGAVAAVGTNGLQNGATFNNNAGGEISIDRSTNTGLLNFAGTFTNVAKITIGAVAAVGQYGLQNNATFNNNAGSEISIDRSTNTGLLNLVSSAFTNAAKITIGAVAAVGTNGLENFATFNNNACGQLLALQGNLLNNATRTITNTGLVQVSNTLQNDGTFTNNGVLKYGTLTGSITNNTNPSIVVNNTPTPIFTYGGTFNGTINGIFTDAAATISAGAFIAPNTFVPSGLPAGLQTLYAKITLSGGSCSYVVPFTYQSCAATATASINYIGSPFCTTASPISVSLTGTSGGTYSSTAGLTINSSTGQITPSSSTAGIYTVTYNVAGECGTVTATTSITIKPTPTSALSASKQDVCPNTEVSLNANCSEVGSTINWNPGGATVTPNAPDVAYMYKASCTLNGCTGNESSVEVRTHRILVDLKDVGMGTQPKALAGVVKDNLSPTNTFLTSTYPSPRLWTILASGCSSSESAVFKLTGPVSFNAIDNNPPYALFANVGSAYFSIDHPNYGQGAQGFPAGTYTLVVDLRAVDGVGGPFPKNRVAVGGLLATRSLQFTIVAPTNRAGVEALSTLRSAVETGEWLSIFQNPVSEEVVLQLSGEVGDEIALNLVNLQGQSIQQKSVKLSSPQQYEVLNVRQQNAGMYILKAIKGGQVKTLKVVKAE